MPTEAMPIDTAADQVALIVHEDKALGDVDVDELFDVLRDRFGDTWDLKRRVRVVPKAKRVPEAVDALLDDDELAEDLARIVVWGGDGTVRRTLHSLVERDRTDLEVAILPAGTANLLARNLDVPLDLDEALSVALGATGPLDLGEVTGSCVGAASSERRHFAVMAGLGLDARVIRRVDRSGFKPLLGRLSHLVGTLQSMPVRRFEVDVEVDGAHWYSGPASSVVVANVAETVGGLRGFPQATPFDGRLDLAVIAASGAGDWVQLARSLRRGEEPDEELVRRATIERAVIEVDRPTPWQADGSDRPRVDRLTVEVLAAAVQVAHPGAGRAT